MNVYNDMDNSLFQYLFSRRQDIIALFSTRQIKINENQIQELIRFILEEQDGVYIADKARSLLGISVEQAYAIENQWYQTIVFPKYEEFFKHNLGLQKEGGSGTLKTGLEHQSGRSRASVGGSQNQKARFYFSTEDEEEIRKLISQRGNDNQFNQREEMEKVYDRIAERIVETIEASRVKT